MKAILFRSKSEGIQLGEINIPVPSAGQVLIKIHYASLNHLDLWIWKEQELEQSIIPGSDGSGIVVGVGEGVSSDIIGKEVLLNPGLHWGPDERIHSEAFEIYGSPTPDGTFAEYMVADQESVFEKPAHLSLKEAAAMPMAALTAYRILFTKARIRKEDRVLITGIGGGVALYLLQMALAHGCKVYVTSSSGEKIQQAMALGAAGGYNYREKDWAQTAQSETGGFDVIVDSAAGNGFAALAEVAAPAARIISIGRTAGNINNLRPGLIYNKQLEIHGSLMGTSREFAAMLDFYSKHQLHPVIDRTFALQNIYDAVQYLESGQHFGKIMLEIG